MNYRIASFDHATATGATGNKQQAAMTIPHDRAASPGNASDVELSRSGHRPRLKGVPFQIMPGEAGHRTITPHRHFPTFEIGKGHRVRYGVAT